MRIFILMMFSILDFFFILADIHLLDDEDEVGGKDYDLLTFLKYFLQMVATMANKRVIAREQ